ncbi:hypothetical protein [Desulfogranum mediterraneum]|uniref:hypothetical protein n=1 Tax=Desulfogranum mediterraneum TaxID=160661 RepID=UPI0004126FB8|nr:hypothetical protein [Desulfogranum mediterraneum]
MQHQLSDVYKGWAIAVKAEAKMCARFSFEIISPSGYRQYVAMGGENRERALERAREMIDLELALEDDS